MYKEKEQTEGFTTLGTDLLNDKSGKVIESFKLNLEKARETVKDVAGTEKGKSVTIQISKAFDAADRIIQRAQITAR